MLGQFTADQLIFAADAVLISHVGVALFVVLGQALIIGGGIFGIGWLRYALFRVIHLGLILFIAGETWYGVVCPLTRLEQNLRILAGQPSYIESFTEHWLRSILFFSAPDWIFTTVHSIAACAIVATWFALPPRWNTARRVDCEIAVRNTAQSGSAPVNPPGKPEHQRVLNVVSKIAIPLFLLAGSLGGCTALTVYNAFSPADAGATLAKANISYGPKPRQKLDVYVPTNATSALPVVVIFYGGSWNSGSKEEYAFLGKALAAKGFVAIVVDHRLVPEVRFPAFLNDAARAVAWASNNAGEFSGDSNKLFLFGHSAGAYIATMVALDGRYLKAAGSSPSVIKGVVALAGPYDFLPLDIDVTKEAFGATADLATTQPINFVSQSAPEMLLATGTADTTVLPRNTFRLADQLKRAGAKVTVRSYPGVSHVGILLALSVPFRGDAPVLDDVSSFIAGNSAR